MKEKEQKLNALDAYLSNLYEKKGYSGIAVCIRGPEGIIFEKGYGYRNLEEKKPINGDTVCGIASMSKSLTSLACCILHAEGKMSLEDPVTKYFPDFHIILPHSLFSTENNKPQRRSSKWKNSSKTSGR